MKKDNKYKFTDFRRWLKVGLQESWVDESDN
jgi:hypothetical protein